MFFLLSHRSAKTLGASEFRGRAFFPNHSSLCHLIGPPNCLHVVNNGDQAKPGGADHGNDLIAATVQASLGSSVLGLIGGRLF